MPPPIVLSSLSTREAIADALYRVTIALDTRDSELFQSAWVESDEIIFDFCGTESKGVDAIRKSVYDLVAPLDTTHIISNMRIDVKEGEDTATMTAAAFAQHYRGGEGLTPDKKYLLSGSIYDVSLVKNATDGQWKILRWGITLNWTEGDLHYIFGPR
jgi:hypothetical protein